MNSVLLKIDSTFLIPKLLAIQTWKKIDGIVDVPLIEQILVTCWSPLLGRMTLREPETIICI